MATLLFAVGLVAARPLWSRSGTATPATCLPDRCFCERPRPAPFRQPSDTWSNLAYVAAGGALLGAGEPLFGALCIFLGAGSAWFHATLTFRGEWVGARFLSPRSCR